MYNFVSELLQASIMASTSSWKSLVRFRDGSGEIYFGEPDEDMKSATIWEGQDVLNLTQSSKTANIVDILAPYVPDTIICIGLNYKEHAAESGVSNSVEESIWKRLTVICSSIFPIIQ